MKQLSTYAPAFIIALGYIVSLLMQLTDIPLQFTWLVLLVLLGQMLHVSRACAVRFLLGVVLGLSYLQFQVALPQPGLLLHGRATVEVTSQSDYLRGGNNFRSYKVWVSEFQGEGALLYGFAATLRVKNSISLKLDGRYILEADLIRDQRSIRLKSNQTSIPFEVSKTFPIDLPWNSLRHKAREAAFCTSALLYRPSQERDFIETVTFGGRLDSIKRAQLNRFGLDHVAAVSGFHFGLVAGFAWWLSLLICRGWQARLLVIVALLGYGFLVGPQPSVLRALLAALLFVCAPFFDRRATGLNNLGVGLLALLLYDPLYIFSLGFQLSFAATLGILLLYKPFSQSLLVGSGLKGDFILGPLCVSLAALCMALPIQILQIGSFSLLGPLYNLIVPLVVGWIMLMYLSSLGAYLLLPGFVGEGLAWMTEKALGALMQFFDGAPQQPHGLCMVSCPLILGCVIYFVMVELAIKLWERSLDSNLIHESSGSDLHLPFGV